jgi:undecaprenyl-diphosphatase
MSVLAMMRTSDDRLWGHLLEWQPPRWFRAWMLTASRLGDGWLWPVAAVLLFVSGHGDAQTLVAMAVAAAVANASLLLVKGRVRRPRPCELTPPRAFDLGPLEWFACDRFSFPSGHALNAFALGAVVALALPAVAVPVLAMAASIAASRVLLGLHWLSDVFAGALAGATIGGSAFFAFVR